MKPFSQGIYQILGALMWRGDSRDYSSEDVLFELLNILDEDVIRFLPHYDNIKKFINKELHWNRLDRETRLSYTKFIYGENIIITT